MKINIGPIEFRKVFDVGAVCHTVEVRWFRKWIVGASTKNSPGRALAHGFYAFDSMPRKAWIRMAVFKLFRVYLITGDYLAINYDEIEGVNLQERSQPGQLGESE